jgi:hypothetical protein
VVTSIDDLLTIEFPALGLYRGGAVLPKEVGLVCLEKFADWLASRPNVRWQVTVSREAGYWFDPLALASKREELLKRFFSRRGFAVQDWQWLPVTRKVNQLQLVELKGSP